MSAIHFHQKTGPDYPQLNGTEKSENIQYKSHHLNLMNKALKREIKLGANERKRY